MCGSGPTGGSTFRGRPCRRWCRACSMRNGGADMAGTRPVLLLMDFQQAIVERLGAPGVIEAADRAARAARAAGIPVMFVRVAFRPGYPEVAAANSTFAAAAESG